MNFDALKQCAAAWLALAATATALPLQEPAAAQVSSDAQAEFDALDAEVSKVMGEFNADLRKRFQAAEAAGEEPPVVDFAAPLLPFVPRFEAAAAKYAGKEDAVPFLVWLAQNAHRATPESAQGAFATLVESHVKSPGLEPLARMLPRAREWFGPEKGDALLRRLEEQRAVGELRGWATFARLSDTIESAALDSEAYQQARATLSGVADESESRQLVMEIRNQIGVRETFGHGMVAPDITGIDLDGVEFKLSDYEGKVVFLDFWGNW